MVHRTRLPMSAYPKKLSQYLLAYRLPVVLGFSCVFGAIAVGLATPFILRFAIDGIRDRSITTEQLLIYAALYLLATILSMALSVGMRRILLGLSYIVEYDIRRDVFDHLTRLDFGFYQRERTGDIMTKMTSDLAAVRDLIGQGLLQGSRILLGFPIAFSIMFAINVRMAATILALFPFISLAFFLLIGKIRKHYDLCQDQFSNITNFAQETFSGFRTIKGFGIEDRRRGMFKELNDEYIRRNMVLTRIEEPVWPFMSFAFSFGILLLLLIGGRQVIDGVLSIGELVQFNQYLTYLQWPMLALGWTTNLFQRGIASWKRIRTILDAQPDIREPATPVAEASVVRGDIAVQGVSLLRDQRFVLKDINLTIPEGQSLGITGPTGSGKTMLLLLVMRMIDPSTGRITIDGRDLRDYPLEILRRSMGVAPQESFLFSDTLANNLGLGLAEFQEDKVLWAAQIAQLLPEVNQFPAKFSTLLGERGVTLSGGQRQRTAIGRAIARQPSILILDDTFSAVDTQTEAKILELLLPVLEGRTSILVSHRVSTLRHASRILVMQDGRIVQDGSHEELVRQPGYYAELAETQRLEARLEEDGG